MQCGAVEPAGPDDRRRRMRWLRGAFVVAMVAGLGLFVGPVTPACACDCALRTPEQSREDAHAVFVGAVTDVDRPLFGSSSGAPMRVTLRVSKVYKGDVPAVLTLTTAVEGASCGYGFTPGGEYLVFASSSEKGLASGLCMGNRDLAAESDPFTGGYAPLPAPTERPGWIV